MMRVINPRRLEVFALLEFAKIKDKMKVHADKIPAEDEKAKALFVSTMVETVNVVKRDMLDYFNQIEKESTTDKVN